MRVKEKSEKLAYNSAFRKLKSWHLVPSLHGKQNRKKAEAVTDFISGGGGRSWGGPPKSLLTVTAAMKLKDACSLEGKL